MVLKECTKHNTLITELSDADKARVKEILAELQLIYGAESVSIRRKDIYYTNANGSADYIIDITGSSVGKEYKK